MKSVIQIAREIEVSPQAIYKRIKTNPKLLKEIDAHITYQGGMKFDNHGEEVIKALFRVDNQVDNLVVNQITSTIKVNSVDNQVDNSMVYQLHDEVIYLRKQLDTQKEVPFLRERLSIAEERNQELALRIANLVDNTLTLIIMLEARFNNQVKQPKKGFWSRIFGK